MMQKLKRQLKRHPHRFITEQPVKPPGQATPPIVPQKRRRIKYGPIPGINPGATFPSRRACADAGVHAVDVPGIHGTAHGAYSVCLSGGCYKDDKDYGDVFEYTGTGGQKDGYRGEHEQVAHQSFKHPHNASLRTSMRFKKPVRVVRGANPHSKWAPAEGYRYDGEYLVEEAFYAEGVSGHNMCKFRLRKRDNGYQIPVNPAYRGPSGNNGV